MNRIIKEGDDLTYGGKINGDQGLKPGDFIGDTLDNNKDVMCYFMNRQFGTVLKEDTTIWIDGDLLGEANNIVFRNGPDSDVPWQINSATIRPIPNTTVKARHIECHGLKYLRLLGSSESYPGLSGLNKSPFCSGNFGFHVKGKENGHNFHLSVIDGGIAEVEGIESQYGYSGVRFCDKQINKTVGLKLTNSYVHDIATGEGLYLGMSITGVAPKLKLGIHDMFIARTAQELLQVQHIVGSKIHNLTCVAGDTTWMAAWQQFQSTGFQWTCAAGVNEIYNILLDGWATVAMNPFGSNQVQNGGTAKAFNIMFNDGRETGHYLHNSESFGMQWLFNNIYYRGFNGTSVSRAKNKLTPYIVSARYGTDKFKFENITYDNSIERFLQKNDPGIETKNIVRADTPAPRYKNSGFVEPMSAIVQWAQYWKFHPIIGSMNGAPVPIEYLLGDIVIDHLENKFYKCVKQHNATDKRPKENDSFLPLKWDAVGNRVDSASWNSSLSQFDYPPDDLRLIEDWYIDRGIGYMDNEKIISTACKSNVRTTTLNTGRVFDEDLSKFIKKYYL